MGAVITNFTSKEYKGSWKRKHVKFLKSENNEWEGKK